jgi:hypothetical protein
MIAARKRHAAFSGSSLEWLDVGNPRVAAYLRRNGADVVLVLSSLSHQVERVPVPAPYRKPCQDLLSSASISLGAELDLKPYSYLWLQLPNGDGAS